MLIAVQILKYVLLDEKWKIDGAPSVHRKVAISPLPITQYFFQVFRWPLMKDNSYKAPFIYPLKTTQ